MKQALFVFNLSLTRGNNKGDKKKFYSIPKLYWLTFNNFARGYGKIGRQQPLT